MHCSSLQLKVFATILFVAANALNQANAQAVRSTTEVQTLPAPKALDSAILGMKRGHKVILVTTKDPTVKRSCRLDSAADDEIRCQRAFHTHPAIYRIADLDTIIEPADSYFDWTFIFPFAIGGGIVTGACFLAELSAVALIGAIPIGIIGTVVVLLSLVVAWSPENYMPAIVLYQRPGTLVGVKL